MSQITNLLKNSITYKILVDIFLVMILVTGGFIIIETILPGLISAYVSWFILFGSIFLIATLISFTARKQNIHVPIKKSKKTLLILSTLLFTILILIASVGYGYFFGSIIIIFSIIIFVLLHYLIEDAIHKH